MNPDYTVAICNYNMAETLERSLRSILEQTDDRFEVLLVDDASTDNSVEVARVLKSEFERLRIIELEADPNRNLGKTRNISVREANGDHVLLQLDADDVYERVIEDFVELYTQLRDQLDFEFYFKGTNINMGSRNFLLEYGPYRNLPVGAEDLDLWRRLLADDALIWLMHDSISLEIGYGKDWRDHLRREFKLRIGEFQSGISLRSYLAWSFEKWSANNQSTLGFSYDILTLPICFLLSRRLKTYSLPAQYKEKSVLPRMINEKRMTASEIEETYDVTFKLDKYTKQGRKSLLDIPNK